MDNTTITKVIKLTHPQYLRSLQNSNMIHLWLYNRNINGKKTHRNGISLNMWKGAPQLCVVLEQNMTINDKEIERIFGTGSFIYGAVSPNDKEQMFTDVYYIATAESHAKAKK